MVNFYFLVFRRIILFQPKSEIIQNNKTFYIENIKTTFSRLLSIGCHQYKKTPVADAFMFNYIEPSIFLN